MRNLEPKPRTRRDVHEQVAKILQDLGRPPPPPKRSDVRALLKLDLRSYSTADTGFLREKVHQMKIGLRQILARPALPSKPSENSV